VEPADRRIAPLGRAECDEAARLLAAAFRDNPLNRAVVRADGARRLRSNLAGTRASLAAIWPRATLLGARVQGRLCGVLVGVAPDALAGHAPPLLAQLRCVIGQGWGTALRWGRVHRELVALRPAEPHAYLDLLGVDAGSRGRGVGRQLLRAWLERVDAQGDASYLETDRKANVRFYERAGFRVLAEERIADTAVWRMWRPARGTRRRGG